MCRLCSQLCHRASTPATSPLLLWAFERAEEFQFSTGLIAQQRLCVCNKAPPNSWPSLLADLASQANTHIHPKVTSPRRSCFFRDGDMMPPPPINCVLVVWGTSGRSGWLASNCFWLLEGPFYVTYGIFESQEGALYWVLMSQGHCKERVLNPFLMEKYHIF